MKKSFTVLALFTLVLCVYPAMGLDIRNMADFVERGYASSLTEQQVSEYVANWTEEDWTEFYAALGKANRVLDPEAFADALIAEDRRLAGLNPGIDQHSATIPRTHTYNSTMRKAHYWKTAAYGCDNDADLDFQYHFQVSATNVANMKWYSTNGWIGLIVGGWSGRLKAFGTSAYTKVCIGDTRIRIVGGVHGITTGAQWVHNALRLKP